MITNGIVPQTLGAASFRRELGRRTITSGSSDREFWRRGEGPALGGAVCWPVTLNQVLGRTRTIEVSVGVCMTALTGGGNRHVEVQNLEVVAVIKAEQGAGWY